MRALLLVLGGLAAVGLLTAGGLITADAADDLSETRLGETRTSIPGRRTVELEQRKYVVYYEEEGSSDESLEIPALAVSIRDAQREELLEFDDFNGTFTITSGGRQAEAWRTVEVPRAGRYTIQARGEPSEADEPAVVLGRPILARILRLVLGIVGVLAGISAAALVIALAIALGVRRSAN